MNSRSRIPERIRTRLSEAIARKNRNYLTGAERILEEIVRVEPGYAPAVWLLGGVYWQHYRLPDAIRSFQRAVELAPESEKASLALFHTLWEAGEQDRAIAEMRRFLAVAHSTDYEGISKELAAEQGTRSAHGGPARGRTAKPGKPARRSKLPPRPNAEKVPARGKRKTG